MFLKYGLTIAMLGVTKNVCVIGKRLVLGNAEKRLVSYKQTAPFCSCLIEIEK